MGKLSACLRSQILEERDGSRKLLRAEHLLSVLLPVSSNLHWASRTSRGSQLLGLVYNILSSSPPQEAQSGPEAQQIWPWGVEGSRRWQAVSHRQPRWRLQRDRYRTGMSRRGIKPLSCRAGPICPTRRHRERQGQARRWRWEAAAGCPGGMLFPLWAQGGCSIRLVSDLKYIC